MKKSKLTKPVLTPGTTLIDTHCHLDMGANDGSLDVTIQNAAHEGVTGIITVGIDVASSRKAVELAKRFPGVWATIGIHPHNSEICNRKTLSQLREVALDNEHNVVGYGEIGLDFAKKYAPRDVQITSFEAQIELAKDLDLPVIIHDREAHDETLDILKAHTPFPALGVMHCFSGDIRLAEKIIDMGLYISIPGIVTFKKSDKMQQVAREIPLERMILETDAPFLAPVPYRGKTNKPEYLLYTAQKTAELRGISLDEVATQTTANTETLFRLKQG